MGEGCSSSRCATSAPQGKAVYTLVRRFIKTGIVFLFVGLAIGGWMQVQRDVPSVWPDPYLRSAHIHAVLVGFVMFLILGVALWLFPRPAPDDPRYTSARAWPRPRRFGLQEKSVGLSWG